MVHTEHDEMTGWGGGISQSAAHKGLGSQLFSFVLILLGSGCCTVWFPMSPSLCQGRKREKLLLPRLRSLNAMSSIAPSST
jgi:hypothetical protein